MNMLSLQARAIVWATSERGRITLRAGGRVAFALAVTASVALRPWVAPWLVGLWSVVTLLKAVDDHRQSLALAAILAEAHHSADCRVWIGGELVWGRRVADGRVQLRSQPVVGESWKSYSVGDVVPVWPGNHPDEYFLDNYADEVLDESDPDGGETATEQKERAR